MGPSNWDRFLMHGLDWFWWLMPVVLFLMLLVLLRVSRDLRRIADALDVAVGSVQGRSVLDLPRQDRVEHAVPKPSMLSTFGR